MGVKEVSCVSSFCFFFGRQCQGDCERFHILQSFEGEKGVRIVRDEDSAAQVASACIDFRVEQFLVLVGCQGEHAVVISL